MILTQLRHVLSYIAPPEVIPVAVVTQQPGNFSATQWSSTTLGTTSVLIEKRMNSNNYNNKSGLLIKSSRLEISAIFIVAIFIATVNIKKMTLSMFTSLITQTEWEVKCLFGS